MNGRKYTVDDARIHQMDIKSVAVKDLQDACVATSLMPPQLLANDTTDCSSVFSCCCSIRDVDVSVMSEELKQLHAEFMDFDGVLLASSRPAVIYEVWAATQLHHVLLFRRSVVMHAASCCARTCSAPSSTASSARS